MPVVGWENEYEVSDRGRVRSIARVVQRVRRGSQTIHERILNYGIANNGYPRVNLSRQSKVTGYLVHRLVLEAFVGPCPANMEALHHDGDKTNCTLSNLRWGTSAENKADMRRHYGYWPAGRARPAR